MRAIIIVRLKKEASFIVMTKKQLKHWVKRVVLGCFFVFINLFGFTSMIGLPAQPVYAIPTEDGDTTTEVTEEPGRGVEANHGEETEEDAEDAQEEEGETSKLLDTKKTGDNSCKKSLGAIGWLVCPTTGKIAEAVDWLYDKIENILIIDPVPAKDGSPIFEIWKYIKGVTNIVFIIFLLVVIYSQITGIGITNYGIKKVLPKLIITAVLVNISFLICQLAVDLSNIIGNGLRGVFASISEIAVANMNTDSVQYKTFSDMYSALGGTIAAGTGVGMVALGLGEIWMLIPTVLGALVAVVTGLITIALRQAVVALLIMVSPLAMVANIMPNTEKWFKKWKDLLLKMIIFYPMFSLLFGASQLAGFAIVVSAKDGFGVLLGMAVQIFPLFFSWSLMKMSGTFLGGINAKLNSLAARPLAANRAWADSHRQLTRAKHIERNQAPSAKLLNFLAQRKTNREADIEELNAFNKSKYLAGRTLRSYDRDGNLSEHGQREADRQALSMRYSQIIEMHKNNLNEGFSGHSDEYKRTIAEAKRNFNTSRGVFASSIRGDTLQERIENLDSANMNASDDLKMELARGAKIEYDNAKHFHERVTDAMNAHVDLEAIRNGNTLHEFHGVLEDDANIARYERMREIMGGRDIDTHFVAADAAHMFNAQSQVVRGKFKDYFNYTVPTQDVVNLLNGLTKSGEASNYIDPIVAGLRTLNMRGDTDLVRAQINNLTADGKIELGTYAAQSLSSFCMFDVKDSDPTLRRFGKYINLETAKMFNEPDSGRPEDRRTRRDVTLYEYINGEYVDQDEDGNVINDESGRPKMRKSKRAIDTLLKGTSFKGMERTAIKNMTETIREQSYTIDEDGNKVFDYEKFKKNEEKIWNAIMPNIISDQASFLSGSEQIVALGKGITGVDVKDHKIDWEGIFGKDIASSLTPEQKADYVEALHGRTKKFLEGHVPVQIARTKTDMLGAITTQYALRDAIKEGVEYDENGNVIRVNNPDVLEKSYKDDESGYKQFEAGRLENIKKDFAGSFKADALEGFRKMYRKGYQGEAKDGLVQLLKDVLDKPSREEEESQKRETRTSQPQPEDGGMPVIDDSDVRGFGGSSYNEARIQIESIGDEYRGQNGYNVEEYWGRVKEILSSSPEMSGLSVFIEEIEAGLSQYTDVASLQARIINEFFGSD